MHKKLIILGVFSGLMVGDLPAEISIVKQAKEYYCTVSENFKSVRKNGLSEKQRKRVMKLSTMVVKIGGMAVVLVVGPFGINWLLKNKRTSRSSASTGSSTTTAANSSSSQTTDSGHCEIPEPSTSSFSAKSQPSSFVLRSAANGQEPNGEVDNSVGTLGDFSVSDLTSSLTPEELGEPGLDDTASKDNPYIAELTALLKQATDGKQEASAASSGKGEDNASSIEDKLAVWDKLNDEDKQKKEAIESEVN